MPEYNEYNDPQWLAKCYYQSCGQGAWKHVKEMSKIIADFLNIDLSQVEYETVEYGRIVNKWKGDVKISSN
jgi:hypothetical protein